MADFADTIGSMSERIEVQRTIAAPAADIFAVLCDPQGHVAIDASGMLQDAEGDPVQAVGDVFVVHVTTLTAGSRQLLFTRLAREGLVQPGGDYVRRVRRPGPCVRMPGNEIPLA